MSENCSNCGEPIEEEPTDLSEVQAKHDGPVKSESGRVYCSMMCAAEKQGWLYE